VSLRSKRRRSRERAAYSLTGCPAPAGVQMYVASVW
jgi:hypothetical protein